MKRSLSLYCEMWAIFTGLESWHIVVLYSCIVSLYFWFVCHVIVQGPWLRNRLQAVKKNLDLTGRRRKKERDMRKGSKVCHNHQIGLTPCRDPCGIQLDFRLGPLWVNRRVTCGLPAGYPHTGPVWAPRTKSHGSHTGIPSGTRVWFPAGTLAGNPAGNLRVTRRVPVHGARVGPADKILWVPRGNPVRDPDTWHDGTRAGPRPVCWLGMQCSTCSTVILAPLVEATVNETLWYFLPLGDYCSLQ